MNYLLDEILLVIYTVADAIAQKDFFRFIREYFFVGRVAVPVCIDLTSIKNREDLFKEPLYKFQEVNYEELYSIKESFSVRSRYYKALHKLRRGMRGFILIKENKIIGDIWCNALKNQITPHYYPDMDLLGLTCTDGEAYVFDIFIDPAYRGKKYAVPIYQQVQQILKHEGWKKQYAYYYEDNISSRWMHWILKFQEQPRISVSRFLFYLRVAQK